MIGIYRKAKQLLDTIGKEHLQSLQDKISRAARLSIVVVDAEMKPVTEPSYYPDCSEIALPNGEIIEQAVNNMQSVMYSCPETGSCSSVIPIAYKGELVGFWLFSGDSSSDSSEITSVLATVVDILYDSMQEIVFFAGKQISAEKKFIQLEEISEHIKNTMETMQILIESANLQTYLVDCEMHEIVMCSDNLAKTVNSKSDSLIGRKCYDVFNQAGRCDNCPLNECLERNSLNNDEPYIWEHYMPEYNKWMQCTSHVTHWEDGRDVMVNTLIDITNRKNLEDEINKLAFEHRLLEIPNSIRLERDIAVKENYCELIVVDIEGLRKINDVYGRHYGDLILLAVRDYILEMDLADSTLYHLDICDFGILIQMDKCANSCAVDIAEKIFNRCEKQWELEYEQHITDIYIAVNICIVPVPIGDGSTFKNFYSTIEHTIEIAREIGSIAVYDDEVERSMTSRLNLEESLKNAVRDNMNGFWLAFQPIVNPSLARWSGIEVLCRWNSRELGAIPPMEFIPIAESNGLIRKIGYWVLEEALKHAKKWKLDKIDNFLLEVNLSPVQLAIQNLSESIVKLLKKYDYPAEKLCLEVTESNELNFSRHNMHSIEELNELGVLIALDDFGTGYSSFNSLHKLPVNIVKTDRTFINGMEDDSYLQRLFHVIVELSHASDMSIVAEGVETDFQAKFLYQQGADYFQGYLFSKPLTAVEMENNLDNFHEVIPLEDGGYLQYFEDAVATEEKSVNTFVTL